MESEVRIEPNTKEEGSIMKRSIYYYGILCLAISANAQLLWVNEFHYDNAGADTGEFFEIAVPASFTDFASVSLSLYRGEDGTVYGTHKLSTFSLGSTLGDYSFYSKEISGVQNGAPDGFSLDQSGSIFQFLSYEGSFSATAGPAIGLSSTDIGLSQSGSTGAGSSLGMAGSGLEFSDFSWTFFSNASPGSSNSGQTFSAMPEPRETFLIAALGLIGFVLHRHYSKRNLALSPTLPSRNKCL